MLNPTQRERLGDLATFALLLTIPASVWFIFFSGDGIDATGRAMTGEEWRAHYEAPLLEARPAEYREGQAHGLAPLSPEPAVQAPPADGWTRYTP